jgi:hypothetical protein
MKHGDFTKESEAIWRGSNAGQDGRSASLTAPNGPAQERCISSAMKEAKTTPPESTAWECHGTGTSLGDPIEVVRWTSMEALNVMQEPDVSTELVRSYEQFYEIGAELVQRWYEIGTKLVRKWYGVGTKLLRSYC